MSKPSTLTATIAKAERDKLSAGFTVRRLSWPTEWTISIGMLNNDIWWSHRSPFTPWIPKWDDLSARDWVLVKRMG